VADLAVNVVGGLEGGLGVIGSALGQVAKRQDGTTSSTIAQNADVNSKCLLFYFRVVPD